VKKLLAVLIATLFAAVTSFAVAADEAKPADAAKHAKAGKKHHKTPEAATPAKQ
jgi:hypothetical protein